MRMTQEHYNYVKSAISLIWTQEKHDAQRRFIASDGKAKDIEKRLRWDWSYQAKISPWVCTNLYTYLDDTHIDTALRSVMEDLQSTSKS